MVSQLVTVGLAQYNKQYRKGRRITTKIIAIKGSWVPQEALVIDISQNQQKIR